MQRAVKDARGLSKHVLESPVDHVQEKSDELEERD